MADDYKGPIFSNPPAVSPFDINLVDFWTLLVSSPEHSFDVAGINQAVDAANQQSQAALLADSVFMKPANDTGQVDPIFIPGQTVVEAMGAVPGLDTISDTAAVADALVRGDTGAAKLAAALALVPGATIGMVKGAKGMKGGAEDLAEAIRRSARTVRHPSTGKNITIPEKLYHVAGGRGDAGDALNYVAGDKLQSLRRLYGETQAADIFEQRWPDMSNISAEHSNQIFFYDNLDDALEHQKFNGGQVLEVDPSALGYIGIDDLEGPSYFVTTDDVPAEAIKLLEPNAQNAAQSAAADLVDPAKKDSADLLASLGPLAALSLAKALMSQDNEQ